MQAAQGCRGPRKEWLRPHPVSLCAVSMAPLTPRCYWLQVLLRLVGSQQGAVRTVLQAKLQGWVPADMGVGSLVELFDTGVQHLVPCEAEGGRGFAWGLLCGAAASVVRWPCRPCPGASSG